MRLFARNFDDTNPVAAAEADLAHKRAEGHRIDQELAEATTRVAAIIQRHEVALLDTPECAASIAGERADAELARSGLEGLRARIAEELAKAEAELSLIRETTQRTEEADRLDAALTEEEAAQAAFEPAARQLIKTLQAMGAARTAGTLAVLVEQALREIATYCAATELRANNLRKPPPPVYEPQIVERPAPHGQASGRAYRPPAGARV
jgi:hypothetical protein